MSTFADKIDTLQKFFALHAADDQPLANRVASMNLAMGVEGEGPLPKQVDLLLLMTGLTAKSGEESKDGAKSGTADVKNGTSLAGVGAQPDPKIAQYMAKHSARTSVPIVDERAQKIAALRTLMEGGPDVPERYRHSDYIPDATQIAGGRSYSDSMVHEWESPSFFKSVATTLASKPASKRCNPVGGKYPEFR